MNKQTFTLQLPSSVLQWIEQARGDMDRSAYIIKLLEELTEKAVGDGAERERWLTEGRTQYTDHVCKQTLEINDEFPIHP